jgi:hypothetical protein
MSWSRSGPPRPLEIDRAELAMGVKTAEFAAAKYFK